MQVDRIYPMNAARCMYLTSCGTLCGAVADWIAYRLSDLQSPVRIPKVPLVPKTLSNSYAQGMRLSLPFFRGR